jgi:hypothetical protein
MINANVFSAVSFTFELVLEEFVLTHLFHVLGEWSRVDLVASNSSTYFHSIAFYGSLSKVCPLSPLQDTETQ